MPLVDHLGGDIWEVRSKLDNRISRTLFAIEADAMILLHAFIKKQQKTPKPDLDLAKDRLKQMTGGSAGSREKSEEAGKKMSNPHIGSRFDEFLAEEAMLEEATAVAVKRVIAWQIEQEMAVQKRTIEGVEIQRGSGNVFADLGFPNAERLKIKTGLVVEIRKAMRALGLTQQEAAKRMGIPLL